MFFLFTFRSSCGPENRSPNSDESVLFPTPVRLRIASRKSQLMELGAIGEHHPDLFLPRPARLKDDVAAVRRPERKIVAPAIVSKLPPLLAGDVHQVNIGGAWIAGTILPRPCHRKELAVGRPVRRNRITLVGHALLVGPVGLHGIHLR